MVLHLQRRETYLFSEICHTVPRDVRYLLKAGNKNRPNLPVTLAWNVKRISFYVCWKSSITSASSQQSTPDVNRNDTRLFALAV